MNICIFLTCRSLSCARLKANRIYMTKILNFFTQEYTINLTSKPGGSPCRCCPTICSVCKVLLLLMLVFFNAVSCQHLKIRISGCLATPFLISRWHQQAVAERGGVLLGGVVAPWFIITLTHPSTQ